MVTNFVVVENGVEIQTRGYERWRQARYSRLGSVGKKVFLRVAFLTTKLVSPVPDLEKRGSRIPLQGTVCRKILFLICVLGTLCTASAQNNAASWQNLNALRLGEKIQVLEENSATSLA